MYSTRGGRGLREGSDYAVVSTGQMVLNVYLYLLLLHILILITYNYTHIYLYIGNCSSDSPSTPQIFICFAPSSEDNCEVPW